MFFSSSVSPFANSPEYPSASSCVNHQQQERRPEKVLKDRSVPQNEKNRQHSRRPGQAFLFRIPALHLQRKSPDRQIKKQHWSDQDRHRQCHSISQEQQTHRRQRKQRRPLPVTVPVILPVSQQPRKTDKGCIHHSKSLQKAQP